jgi:hypothetical protein
VSLQNERTVFLTCRKTTNAAEGLPRVIDDDRLQNVPEAYRDQRSFCFWLHDMMLDVLQQGEAARVADVFIQFDAHEAVPEFTNAEELLNYLRDTGRTDILKRIVLNQVAIPLYGDLIHFVFEALKALEKRKYAVAFTLLRKRSSTALCSRHGFLPMRMISFAG